MKFKRKETVDWKNFKDQVKSKVSVSANEVVLFSVNKDEIEVKVKDVKTQKIKDIAPNPSIKKQIEDLAKKVKW